MGGSGDSGRNPSAKLLPDGPSVLVEVPKAIFLSYVGRMVKTSLSPETGAMCHWVVTSISRPSNV